MERSVRFRHVLSGTLLVAFLSAGCGEEKKGAVISPEVNVVNATQMDVPVFSEFVGQTYGQEDIQIIPRVEGWITGIHFKEGDPVKKGQLLYTIDDLPTRSKVDAANGEMARAETMVANKKADLDRVEPLAAMNPSKFIRRRRLTHCSPKPISFRNPLR